jgi:DNA modification methylase
LSTRIIHGDCREVLKTLADASVHCVVTSPPYWGLRDYGVAGQMGNEPSLAGYIADMVDLFREVRRVLRDDGTAWVNMGDGYNAYNGGAGPSSSLSQTASQQRPQLVTGYGLRSKALKPKDLMMVPARLAIALQDDGWWLRSDVIWAKKNCMPESVRDRPTTAHEHIFLLTKSGSSTFWVHRDLPGVRKQPAPDYRWVHRETREEVATDPGDKVAWRRLNLWEGRDYFYDATAIEEAGEYPAGTTAGKGSRKRSESERVNSRPPEYAIYNGRRNKRSVWHVATQPFAEAHFATMPPAIVEPCILAGTSERGCCLACGAGYVRQVSVTYDNPGNRTTNGPRSVANREITAGFDQRLERRSETTGWVATCACDAGEPVPCVALDPFFGAGTVGIVADRLGRDCIGIELNAEYAAMAERRLHKDAGLFADVTR